MCGKTPPLQYRCPLPVWFSEFAVNQKVPHPLKVCLQTIPVIAPRGLPARSTSFCGTRRASLDPLFRCPYLPVGPHLPTVIFVVGCSLARSARSRSCLRAASRTTSCSGCRPTRTGWGPSRCCAAGPCAQHGRCLLGRCPLPAQQFPAIFALWNAINVVHTDVSSPRHTTQVPMEQIIDAAKRANAHDFIQSFQDGYDTMVCLFGWNDSDPFCPLNLKCHDQIQI